jgi:predicted RNA-binding protein Jag
MTVEKRAATAETVLEALTQIATDLSLEVAQLDYNIDSEQFLNENGQKIGRRDVEVTAWMKVFKPGIQEMQVWLATTIEVLGLEAQVSVRENGSTLHFTIKSEEGGRIIGHRGSTLKSIEKLMNEYSSKEGYEWAYALHVDGGEKRERRRDRDDSRGRDRDRKRGDRGDRGDRREKRDDEGLKRLAKKLASRVLDSGEPLIIEKEFNGYQRRVVHMTIKEFNGVNSESFDDNGARKIRLVKAQSEEESSSSSEG